MSDGSCNQPDHQRSDYDRRPIVHGPLLVQSSDPTPLFESVYTPLHHVAPRVNLGVEVRRSSQAFGPSLALVAPLGDRVRDAAVLEELAAAGKAEAFVGDQALGTFARALRT